ncbi:hypothetical protein Aperf_G00000126235 [Anoplocephala perfoliata]
MAEVTNWLFGTGSVKIGSPWSQYLVSGGNDGALILNELNVDAANISRTGIVKIVADAPKIKKPSSLMKHSFPSDVVFSNSKFTPGFFALYPTAANESVVVSSTLRELFIGPEGKVFAIFESGDLAVLRSSDENTSVLTPIHPSLSPALSGRVSKDARFIQKDGIHLRQNCLFPGFCVGGVHRESGKFALGGRWGCLGVYEFVLGEGDEVRCQDLINIPPFQRFTVIHWLSKHELVAGMYPLLTWLCLEDKSSSGLIDGLFQSLSELSLAMGLMEVYVCLNDSESGDGGLFGNIIYLVRSSPNYKVQDLAWTTCADGCIIEEFNSVRCVLIGTRSGGLGLYTIPSSSSSILKLGSINPSWSYDHCHGREGVTAIKIIHNSIAITAGHQHGRVRRWRIVAHESADSSAVGLQPLDQVLKPSGISWIGAFASLPSGTLLMLGFISTKFLAVEIVPPRGENLISEGGIIHFTSDCAGGHRAWDFAHNLLDDSFTFAAIRKDSLLFARQKDEKTLSVCGFKRKSLIPSFHGRDINTCLMIPLTGINIHGPAVSYHKSIGPTFHAGHTSNIRCLTRVNSYLISGGGRGMLAIWRLDSVNANPPGLVGWVSLDTGVRDFCLLHSCPLDKKRRDANGICDLRIMALLAFQEEEEFISIIAGCSDGSIRLIKMQLPCLTTGWLPKFYQLCDFRSGLKRTCVLSLCELDSAVASRTSIAYTNTAGTVAGLEVDLQNGVVLNRTFSLQLEVENPITEKITGCAANSIVVLKKWIVVAGDDGSLRVADSRGKWITKVTKHFAAVVKITNLDKQCHLLSLGADHRLLLWQLSGEDRLSVISELTVTGLGDPQNISVIEIHGSTREFLAMVCGSGVQLYHFKL